MAKRVLFSSLEIGDIFVAVDPDTEYPAMYVKTVCTTAEVFTCGSCGDGAVINAMSVRGVSHFCDNEEVTHDPAEAVAIYNEWIGGRNEEG